MSGLTDFLLARIAEDEASGDAAVSAEVESCRADGMPDLTEAEVRDYWADQHWWKRRLAECEAKRQRVAILTEMEAADENTLSSYAYSLLCREALPYADHPDYRREEWKP